jgi:ribokinase
LVGSVGDDPFGSAIRTFLEDCRVGTTHLLTDPESGTGVAVPIVYDDGGNTILSIPRANLALTAADILAARRLFEAADILLLQLEVSPEAVSAAVGLARECSLTTILNAAPAAPLPAGVQGVPGVLVVNELEAEALLPGVAGSWPAKAAALLSGSTGLAVITLGEKGAVLARADGSSATIPAFPVMAIDTVGAGDAFCGAFAVALAEGTGVREALRFASAAGALAATRAGAAPSLPIRADIERLMAIG